MDAVLLNTGDQAGTGCVDGLALIHPEQPEHQLLILLMLTGQRDSLGVGGGMGQIKQHIFSVGHLLRVDPDPVDNAGIGDGFPGVVNVQNALPDGGIVHKDGDGLAHRITLILNCDGQNAVQIGLYPSGDDAVIGQTNLHSRTGGQWRGNLQPDGHQTVQTKHGQCSVPKHYIGNSFPLMGKNLLDPATGKGEDFVRSICVFCFLHLFQQMVHGLLNGSDGAHDADPVDQCQRSAFLHKLAVGHQKFLQFDSGGEVDFGLIRRREGTASMKSGSDGALFHSSGENTGLGAVCNRL